LKDGTAYTIYLANENEKTVPPQIKLSSISPARNANVTFLGTKENLKWERVGAELSILIPESIRKNPPCEHAWVFKISAFDK
jgi:alpha-L-fucosidase